MCDRVQYPRKSGLLNTQKYFIINLVYKIEVNRQITKLLFGREKAVKAVIYIALYIGNEYRNRRVVSRDFFPKISHKIGHAANFPAIRKKLFVPIPPESQFEPNWNVTKRLVANTSGGKTMAERLPAEPKFIDFVPFFLQNMSDHRLKCLDKGLVVTKTCFHAGFWYLSRIK